MADRHLAAECDVRKHLLHGPRGIHRFARTQVQQIDVHAIGFIGQIRRDPDGKPFGMRRTRGTVSVQASQLAFAFHDLGIGR